MEQLSKKKQKIILKKKNRNKLRRKQSDKSKRARLFVKNLPFKITEADFKSHFEQFGEVVDAQLLKNADGKLKGCGFINFSKKLSAVKAILKTNNKPFKDRSIHVDWAVPKSKFEKSQKTSSDKTVVKEEEKEEKSFGDEDCDVIETDNEVEEKEEHNVDEKQSKHDWDEEMDSEESEEESNDDCETDNDDGNEEDIKKQEEYMEKENGESKNLKVKSNDVSEGKTVFLRNLPFHIDNARLKQIMLKEFGPDIVYALVCMDPLTEHSKGTGFVKFKTVEEAEACLNKGNLLVDGETVTFHAAMDKKQLSEKQDNKHKKFKDSRNLYLVKEGVVSAGSKAAEGVSVSDMSKRVQLEQWKTQMLRNLHMFVSKTRLIIHNLPPEYDDNQLRSLFKKYSPPKAVIREAKVMRNIRDVDDKGVGKSKEYGFVSFTSHEDALYALRNVNNNPSVFTKFKRPVVAFSIENRAILNAKMRRTEKSKEKNPLYREKYMAEKKAQMGQKRGGNVKNKVKYSVDQTKRRNQQNSEDGKQFKGMHSKPTQNITFAKTHKLTKQLDLHKTNVLNSKKDMKRKKRKQENRLRTKDPVKTKQNKAKNRSTDGEDKQFSKLISSYKSKINLANSNSGMKKWYDT